MRVTLMGWILIIISTIDLYHRVQTMTIQINIYFMNCVELSKGRKTQASINKIKNSPNNTFVYFCYIELVSFTRRVAVFIYII